MSQKRQKLFNECKKKLLEIREECMNGLEATRNSVQQEVKGDEGDIVTTLTDQENNLIRQEKLMAKLRQVDAALDRIERGEYGVCDETGDDIEDKRLLAIPWTTLSLHGAEMRENQNRIFAHTR